MNSKTLLGALAGGIALFFAGWVIYGMGLASFMAANTEQCHLLPMENMVMWAMFLSNLIWAYLLALVFEWTGTRGLMGGLKCGAIIGLLVALYIDFNFFAMSTMFKTPIAMVVDVLASTLMAAIGGAVIGMVMGRGEQPA